MLKTVQASRGLAAICVVLFHLSIAMGDARYGGDRVFWEATRRGNLGVDFFFVLSGFIILLAHHSDIGQPGRWRDYAMKRFIRVYPIYWLYTGMFCALLALGLGMVAKLPETAADWVSALLLVRLTDLTAPLNVAWTLFHEIAFYALFSILIVNRRLGLGAFALWAVAIVVTFQYSPTDHPTPLQTYLSAYNLNFLFGMGAYLLFTGASARVCDIAFWAGLGLLVATLTFEYTGHRNTVTGVLYGLAFAGLLTGMAAWEKRRGKIRLPIADLIGNASYTLYLVHAPIIGLVLKILGALGIIAAAPGQVTFVIALMSTILSGCLAYLVIEKPMLKWFKRALRIRQLTTLSLQSAPG